MKSIQEYINEASISSKKINTKAVEKMFLKGKQYKAIRSFGIVTANNMDSQQQTNQENKKQNKDLLKYLKLNKYVAVPSVGHFAGNSEASYIIFNIELDVLKRIAGKYEQTSFFYCYPDGKSLISEYWEKEDPAKKYNRTTNDYVFINKTDKWNEGTDDCFTNVGKGFKFSIDPEVFDSVEESITNNIKCLCEKRNKEFNEDNFEHFFEWANFRVGYRAQNIRSIVNTFNGNID